MNMEKSRIAIIFLCVFTYSVFINAGEIETLILNESGQPVEGVSGVCLILPDSTYYSGSVSGRNGLINMDFPDSIQWCLRLSCLGYLTAIVPDENFKGLSTNSPADKPFCITLRHKDYSLDEIEITAEKPQVIQKDGKFIYGNLNEIIKSRVAPSAYDLLMNLPLISSADANTPTLAGAPLGSAIYINGRPSQMNQQQIIDYLKNIPSEQVKTIEIIYNPSPKWRTRSAVINVQLKGLRNFSFNGMGQAAGIRKHTDSGDLGLSASANLGHASVNMMYSFNAGKSIGKSINFARHLVGKDTYEISDTSSRKNSMPLHSIYTNFKFDIDSLKSLDVNYYGSFSPKNTNVERYQNSYYGNYLDNSVSHSYLNSIMLIFTNSPGLQAGAEFRNFHSALSEKVLSGLTAGSSDAFAQISHQNVNSFNAYADMANSLPHNWNVIYGAKFEYNINKNTSDNIFSSEHMSVSPSDSKTEEFISSAYTGTSRYFFKNKLYAEASFSMEYYKLKDYCRFNFLPKVTLTFIPNYTHIFQASYSTYNNFPSYWQRQEYASYNNPYSLNVGNPLLKPARYHIANIIYLLKNKYSLSASYYRVNNFFLSQTYLSPDSLVQISQMCNIDFSSLLDLTINIPFNIKKRLYSTLTVSGNLEKFKSSDWHGLSFNVSRLSCIASINNTMIILKKPKLTLNIDGMYRSPSLAGLWMRSNVWMLNAGISSAFLNDKLSLEFKATDILQKAMPYQRMRLGSQWMDSDDNFFGRAFSIKIAYKFNGYKKFDSRIPDTTRVGIQ